MKIVLVICFVWGVIINKVLNGVLLIYGEWGDSRTCVMCDVWNHCQNHKCGDKFKVLGLKPIRLMVGKVMI